MQRPWREVASRTSSMNRSGENARLGNIEKVRSTLVVELPCGGRCCEKARMSAHDDADINSRQGAKIEIDAQKRPCNQLGCGDEPGRMVVFDKVIVDRLRGVDKCDILAGGFGQNLLRPGRIVTADINERGGSGLVQAFEDDLAVGGVRFVARTSKGCARRCGDSAEVLFAQSGKIDEIPVAYTAYAM